MSLERVINILSKADDNVTLQGEEFRINGPGSRQLRLEKADSVFPRVIEGWSVRRKLYREVRDKLHKSDYLRASKHGYLRTECLDVMEQVFFTDPLQGQRYAIY